MTPAQLREAVARAIYGDGPLDWAKMGTGWQAILFAQADAALAVVREALPDETYPDEAPLGLSNDEASAWADGWNAAVVTWRAMLAASALGGGHE